LKCCHDTGRTRAAFQIVFLTGWSPDPSQPKPARRGSATATLGDALNASDQSVARARQDASYASNSASIATGLRSRRPLPRQGIAGGVGRDIRRDDDDQRDRLRITSGADMPNAVIHSAGIRRSTNTIANSSSSRICRFGALRFDIDARRHRCLRQHAGSPVVFDEKDVHGQVARALKEAKGPSCRYVRVMQREMGSGIGWFFSGHVKLPIRST
jgi:hypothetical protein